MSLLSDIGTAIKNKLGGTSVDNTVPRYDGTTCKLQGSGVTISDTNKVTASGGFVGNLTGNAETVTNGVYTTTNQTIEGVKTFSSSPIVPTQTAGDNSTKVATTAFVSSLVGGIATATSSLGINGYQKLPSGLIIQWVYKTGNTANGTITLPIAFPTIALRSFSSYDQNTTTYTNAVPSSSATLTTANYYNAAGGSLVIFVIGY